MKRRIKVYVAGAYSAPNVLQVLKHIGRGQEYAAKLFKMGFAPFTPWLDKEFVINSWKEDFTVDEFYEYSMEWLRASDCVFIVPNNEGLINWQDSKGTVDEIKVAEQEHIPVFYNIDDLRDYTIYEDWRMNKGGKND